MLVVGWGELGDEGVEARGSAGAGVGETVAEEIIVGGDGGGGFALIVSQFVDEGEHVGYVGRGGGPDCEIFGHVRDPPPPIKIACS